MLNFDDLESDLVELLTSPIYVPTQFGFYVECPHCCSTLHFWDDDVSGHDPLTCTECPGDEFFSGAPSE